MFGKLTDNERMYLMAMLCHMQSTHLRAMLQLGRKRTKKAKAELKAQKGAFDEIAGIRHQIMPLGIHAADYPLFESACNHVGALMHELSQNRTQALDLVNS